MNTIDIVATKAIQALVYAIECQIATYELAKSRKRTSQSDLRRHRSLCVRLLDKLSLIEGTGGKDWLMLQIRTENVPRVFVFLDQDREADIWIDG